MTFAGAALVLFVGAVVASLVPALRAARIDPVTALREDSCPESQPNFTLYSRLKAARRVPPGPLNSARRGTHSRTRWFLDKIGTSAGTILIWALSRCLTIGRRIV
ncbi:MAG: hypothetical protein ACRD8O_22490 [Bryobacteraceae bacterium]